MNVVLEFATYAIEGSGLAASLLLSCLAALSMRTGKCEGALAKQALGFFALFLVSLVVYVVL